MDENTLAPEANFDALDGISYTKGCYTGQETVARVHFRGHVNRYLRGLASDTPDCARRAALRGRRPTVWRCAQQRDVAPARSHCDGDGAARGGGRKHDHGAVGRWRVPGAPDGTAVPAELNRTCAVTDCSPILRRQKGAAPGRALRASTSCRTTAPSSSAPSFIDESVFVVVVVVVVVDFDESIFIPVSIAAGAAAAAAGAAAGASAFFSSPEHAATTSTAGDKCNAFHGAISIDEYLRARSRLRLVRSARTPRKAIGFR